jgi:hypothetical protein
MASVSDPIVPSPARTATIGRRRATRRAMRANLRGLPKVSVYIAMTRVRASSSQNWSRSLPEMSALSPSETNDDTPRSSRRASSRNDAPSDPDCIDTPTGPAFSVPGARWASNGASSAVVKTPMLPGPMIRTP